MSPRKKEVTLQMTQTQINRYHTIKNSLDGKMTVAEAAAVLGISERQVKRLRNGVKEEGAAFLMHKRKGRASPQAVSDAEKRKIQELYRGEPYTGANFLHFSELLREHEGISYSYTTIRKALTEGGIESPKKRRRFKPHRRRKRKAQEGLLIQIDSSPHEWFGGRAKYALHGAIDDATGKFSGAYMTKNECLHGYFEVMRQIIERDGIPVSAYSDRHAIFVSPKDGKLTVQEQLEGKVINDTQFGRAMKELGITLILARSAQAKGRVERLWETLQSRLVIEFRIRGIKTVEAANAFLMEYIPKFNEQFSVEAELAEKMYRANTLDLGLVLCVKAPRVVDKGGVFSFSGKLWKTTNAWLPSSKFSVEVVVSAARGIIALYKGKELDVLPYVKPKRAKPEPKQPSTLGHRAHGKWEGSQPNRSFDLADSEIRKMLEDIFLSRYA
jgi:transposase